MTRRALRPVFLLTLPILAMNLALFARLPATYQPDVFNADIPPLLRWSENGLRITLFALMAFLPMSAPRTARRGWALFLIGVTVYLVSWLALILAPSSSWSTSWMGFTAPAWSPALWLVGIGLIAQPPVFSNLFSGVLRGNVAWKAVYWSLATGFLIAHLLHATLIWDRYL